MCTSISVTFNGRTCLFNSQAITFGSVTVGAPYNYPQVFNQNVQEYRDDLFYLARKHSLKFGAELLYDANTGLFQQNQAGTASACASIVAKTVNGVSYTATQVANDLFPNGTTNIASWNYTNNNDATHTSINSLCALGTFTQGLRILTSTSPEHRSPFGPRMTIRSWHASPST